MTIRARLLSTVLVLMVAAAAVIGSASVVSVRTFLTSTLDDQIDAAAEASLPGVDLDDASGQGGDSDGYGRGARQVGLSLGTVVVQCVETPDAYVSDETVARYVQDDQLVGQVVEFSGTSTLDAEQLEQLVRVAADGGHHTVDVPGLGTYRVLAVTSSTGYWWLIGVPMDDVDHTAKRLAVGITLVSLGMLAAAGLLGSYLIRRTLAPLNRVTATALRVSELPLSSGDADIAARVPVQDTDPRTEVGQVGTALNRLLDHIGASLAARQASENRVRRFVSDASHELRTPLASIRGYAELARRTHADVPAEVAHALSRVQSEADRMTALVEDLLLLARLDERRPLEREEVDLTILAIDAVSDARAAGAEHVWRLDLPEEPVAVTGDRNRLHQVVTNLLTNARVHTQPGTQVTTALRVDVAAREAVLTVTDTGPGIPEQLQGEVFGRFTKGDSARTRGKGSSTGLGLSIVASVVASHGGTVGLRSHPGMTCFEVRLPWQPEAPGTGGPTTLGA